jgi:hypothetical protein
VVGLRQIDGMHTAAPSKIGFWAVVGLSDVEKQ